MEVQYKECEHHVFAALTEHMIEHRQYSILQETLHQADAKKWQKQITLTQLAQAYLTNDLESIRELAVVLERNYLLAPSQLELRIYSYIHHMNQLYERQAWTDYFRAISPVMVDLFALLIERHAIPELSHYMEPVINPTDDGRQIYKGLHWIQEKIEADDNLIRKTWQNYYGDYFNYGHYVSSSHLIKLMQDTMDPSFVTPAQTLRRIEKDIRNIVAHEAIYLSPERIYHRSLMTAEEIHQLLHHLCQQAQLNDPRQIGILSNIDEELRTSIHQDF